MTIFGWDASHYDGPLSETTLVTAKSQGIELFTHKLGEGNDQDDNDSTAAAALTNAKNAGISVLGGYWFCWGDSPAVAQADLFIEVADAMVPWWRTHPHWFWQPDCETETGHGKPSPSWIKQFSDHLVAKTGRLVIVYASHGMYANTLSGLGHPLWNANYPSNRQAPFKSLYPGDSYPGWNPYSSQTPVLAQYSSTATIAGKTTCDANAYRGTLTQLQALVTGPPSAPTTPDTGDTMPTAEEIVNAYFAHKLPDGQTIDAWYQANDARTSTEVNVQNKTIIDTLAVIAENTTPVAVPPNPPATT
jgi:lysozyme